MKSDDVDEELVNQSQKEVMNQTIPSPTQDVVIHPSLGIRVVWFTRLYLQPGCLDLSIHTINFIL